MTERHGKFDELFQILDAIKGQEVICIYSELASDEYKGFRGKLKQVDPYDSVTFELGDSYNFIGERNAIVLLSVEMNGKQHNLYTNPDIPKKYTGYFNDPFGLMSAQKEQLGYSVKEEQMTKGNANRAK